MYTTKLHPQYHALHNEVLVTDTRITGYDFQDTIVFICSHKATHNTKINNTNYNGKYLSLHYIDIVNHI